MMNSYLLSIIANILPHQRPTTPGATNPAMLAASQAFNNTEAGQKRLAQGAAAAALRSMSPTSTPVGQIQTKRMMERQSSVGAAHSAQRGRAGPSQMVRRNSSSSMTERTFREPSPGRPSTASGLPASRQPQPPVPRVPDAFTNIPPVPKKTQRRSASIDEIGMRRNNNNNMGQTPPRNSVRDSSYSRPAAVNPAAAAAKKVAASHNSPALTRTDSNSSVNFSYPGRSRPISPPPQKQFQDSPRQDTTPSKATPVRAAKPSPSAISGISQTEARNIQRDLAQVAQQPVKKRKKKDGPLSEGTHLLAGGSGAKPKVHPLEPGPPVASDVDDESEPDRSRHRARLTGEASHFPSSPTSPTDTSQASDSDSERVQARRALRASGALQKQPSVVREDWEGEQEEIASSPAEPLPQPRAGSKKRQTPAANVARKIDDAGTPTRTQADQRDHIVTPQSLTAPEARKPSLSPSRSTRFSNRLSSDMTQGQKHNPPPRSVSPRKPALKHSASPQGLSVDRVRDSSLSPSEGTDVSYDGMPRRVKKSAHVKFDTHPEVVGIAAEPDPQLLAESPVVVSPQYREQPKKWYAMNRRSQPRVALSDDSDDDDAMKPRPQLPTFGSVRNRRNEVDNTPQPPAISTPSSSSSSSISSGTPPATMNTSISSDHAIGAMINKDQAEKQKQTSFSRQSQVGYVEEQPSRDARESRSQDNGKRISLPVMNQQRTEPTSASRTNGELPSIAVLPATPGTEEEEHKPSDQWLVEVPGGFPSAHQSSTSSYSQVTDNGEDHAPYEDHREQIDRMSVIQEESDRDSVYSDAAEDLSDLEGDGFGSIAAIVHSPIASPTPRSPDVDSPAPAAPQRNVEKESGQKEDPWENAGARWKGLAESAKRTSLQPSAPIVERSTQQSQRTRAREDDFDTELTSTESSPSAPHQDLSYHAVTTDPTEDEKPNFKRTMRTPTPELTARNTARNGKPSEPVDFAPKMRNSMRNSAPAAPRNEAPVSLRGSMRDSSGNRQAREDPPVKIRTSMRDTGAAPSDDGTKPLRASMREANAGAVAKAPKAARGSVPARTSSGAGAAALVAAKPAPVPRATLQKRNPDVAQPATGRKTFLPVHDDSDSDSSFRKRRRAKANDTGRYSMRRSMRQEASPEPSAADRRAVRSLSPVQRRPFSPSSEQVNMRTTMRGSFSGGEAPTLRNTGAAQRSSSLFGRRKDARSPTRPMSLRMGSSSRVADSDDDRSNLPKVYKSRFQDSDDEDAGFRPVRGIPRKTKDDDSTDLEDSSDEERSRKAAPPKKLSLATATSKDPIADEPASPTSPDGKKKRGFFGRLRKNKDETANPSNKEPEPMVNGKEEKVNGKQSANSAALGFNSDAEKEALIEATRRKLEAAKDEPTEAESLPAIPAQSQPQAQPQRIVPQRHKSDSWPLVPKIVDENDRPYTADGEAARPDLYRNSSSGTPIPSSPGGSSQGKTGKKKRFPLLRKAFGLKD